MLVLVKRTVSLKIRTNVDCRGHQIMTVLVVHAVKGLAFNDCHEDGSTAAPLFGRI
jgi:hypothetical protein